MLRAAYSAPTQVIAELKRYATKGESLMRSLLIIASLVMMAAAGQAETKSGIPTARDCATAYFEALMQADVERANALIAVPFLFDRKEILKSKEEVEKKHRAIAAEKGQRKVPEYTVSVPKDAPALDQTGFSEYEVFRITILEAKEHIDIYVTKGASPKVIGFSD
jgi:hypothetical protein